MPPARVAKGVIGTTSVPSMPTTVPSFEPADADADGFTRRQRVVFQVRGQEMEGYRFTWDQRDALEAKIATGIQRIELLERLLPEPFYQALEAMGNDTANPLLPSTTLGITDYLLARLRGSRPPATPPRWEDDWQTEQFAEKAAWPFEVRGVRMRCKRLDWATQADMAADLTARNQEAIDTGKRFDRDREVLKWVLTESSYEKLMAMANDRAEPLAADTIAGVIRHVEAGLAGKLDGQAVEVADDPK